MDKRELFDEMMEKSGRAPHGWLKCLKGGCSAGMRTAEDIKALERRAIIHKTKKKPLKV